MGEFRAAIITMAMGGMLAGCAAPKPKTEDFASSIAQFTNGYEIDDLKCESFANKEQEKSGRAGCRGTLSLMFDLYEPMSGEGAEAALVAAGIPATGARWFRQRHSRAILTKSASQGSKTSFSAECSYAGVVDGWGVSCSPSYQRFPGQPLGSRGDNSIARGTPEYTAYINEVIADYRRLDAAYLEVKNGIERFFARGRTLRNRDGTIRSEMVSPLVWTGERGFLGYQYAFHMETKYQDGRERTDSTFCGYQKGTPRDDIRFDGVINYNRDRATGQDTFPAFVAMSDRASQYQNRFFGCGNRLRWDGSMFKGGYSGTAELRSE